MHPPERIPLPDADGFELPKLDQSCFCGADGVENYRGWWLCRSCLPRVRLAVVRRDRGPGAMATSIKRPKR